MNGYQVDTANLAELSRIGNSNQRIGDVEPQANYYNNSSYTYFNSAPMCSCYHNYCNFQKALFLSKL